MASFGQTISKSLNTIVVVADTASTLIQAAGNLATVAEAYSTEYVTNTKREITLNMEIVKLTAVQSAVEREVNLQLEVASNIKKWNITPESYQALQDKYLAMC